MRFLCAEEGQEMTKRFGSRETDFDAALRQSISYCADTGIFTWVLPPRRGVSIGATAGSKTAHGYLSISFRSCSIYAHRLAWFITHGCWPAGVIDHINGDKLDNRIINLRDVSQRDNTENVFARRKHNRAGLLGVSQNGNRFTAHLGHMGKNLYLGIYKTKEEAHEAYLMKKRELHQGNTL